MPERPTGNESIDEAVSHAQPVPDPVPRDDSPRTDDEIATTLDSGNDAAEDLLAVTDIPLAPDPEEQ